MAILTESEVFSDLRELHRNASPSDTDGDSSVDSDEVMSSHYPVKPRKTFRLADREDLQASYDRFSDVNSPEIDEALMFIKKITASHRDLYDAECQREDIESTLEVSAFASLNN